MAASCNRSARALARRSHRRRHGQRLDRDPVDRREQRRGAIAAPDHRRQPGEDLLVGALERGGQAGWLGAMPTKANQISASCRRSVVERQRLLEQLGERRVARLTDAGGGALGRLLEREEEQLLARGEVVGAGRPRTARLGGHVADRSRLGAAPQITRQTAAGARGRSS